MEESLSVSRVKYTRGMQESARTEEPEGHTEMTEAKDPQGLLKPRIQQDLQEMRTSLAGQQVQSWPPAPLSFFSPGNFSFLSQPTS